MQGPITAIVATTYRCNARCLMCDIWKKQPSKKDELRPDEYAALPKTLQDINITGGEPFLREDLPDVVRVVKNACPQARIVISTNGLLVERIKSMIPELLRIDPEVAIRVSVDGIGTYHDSIRGVSGAFSKAVQSISAAKEASVKDLGIAMTLMDVNVDQLMDVYCYASDVKVDFSVTLASSSEIYFGATKSDLRPQAIEQLKSLSKQEYLKWKPRYWFRGWFADTLDQYVTDGKRNLPCDAGFGFFYLDPSGTLYACHLKSALMGNLSKQTFDEVWGSPQAEKAREILSGCEDCWMVCTCKSEIIRRRNQIGSLLLKKKLKTYL